MKQEEVLKKAIEKAYNNGWRWKDKRLSLGTILKYIFDEYDGCAPEVYIFSHDFAKAFWGEKQCLGALQSGLVNWQYHLQKMVLEEDAVKYLEQFL